jgi:arginyl-tRNA synthetase
MLQLISEIGRQAAAALRSSLPDAALPDELAVGHAQRPDLGDLQISAAMQLAKPLKKKPREVAETIVSGLHHPAIAEMRIDGPGFINLRLKDEWLSAEADRVYRGGTSGLRNIGGGERVVIDYSSPNVAKPMHIAHIRSTIIGEALKRVLRAVGYQVVADNHIGDWGTQFGKLIVAYRRWLDPIAFEKSAVEELLRLYIKFVDEEKRQKQALPNAPAGADGSEDDEELPPDAPPILKEARAELVKLQQGDAENRALWQKFVDVSRAEFDRVYRRLGVSFDVTLGESFYNDRLAATVDRLIECGIAKESRGAIVVFFDKEPGGEALEPFLVKKADGGYLYGTSDVAGLLYRMETWSPTRILIVTDERQQLHFRQLFATGRRLGVTASLEHVWFGLMRLPEGTISTREGKLIGLEQLLDEAERRAFDVGREHSPELSEAELKEVARVVGIGAVKYNDLSKDRQTMVTFTWDKALSLQGNTAPYLQYAYARMRSILRKAAAESAEPGAIASKGALSAVERALVSKLLWYPEAVEQVARTARPHILSDYLYELAATFSSFYTDEPVLKAEPKVRDARLALCDLTAVTIRSGLELLGIEVLERM